ncbi:MAG TPA: polysaccharide biosynthesis tyrosine autokinase [Azospirillaceae bacterium]|nr:polysaccharide biosynthesis tyrosine autokinase [Azospirillaceae bacterium]
MMKHPTPQDTGETTLDIGAALGALRRRKWTILGTMLLGIGLAGGLTLGLTPQYTATSVVVIEPRNVRAFEPTKPLGPTHDNQETYIENQVKSLISRGNIRQAILDLGLHQDGAYDPDPPLFSPERFVQAKDWVATRFGFTSPALAQADKAPSATHRETGAPTSTTAPAPTVSARTAPMEIDEPFFRAIEENLKIARSGQSGVITVSATATTPERAAQIADAIVDAYIRTQREQKVTAIQRASRWLTEQAAGMRDQVLEAERAVEDYRAANKLKEGQDYNLNPEQLVALATDVNAAQADRIAKETRLQHVNELRARRDGYKPLIEISSSPIIVNLVQRDEELLRQEAQLATNYGPRHPLVQQAQNERERLARKMDQEIVNIIRNLEGEVAVARAREDTLSGFLEQAKTQSATAGTAGIQLRDLEREAASRRAVYEAMLLRTAEIQNQTGLAEADAKVLSLASPPDKPTFPRPKIMLVLGAVAGLMSGTGLAALREHLDRGVRTNRQVEEALGVSALGLIPRIRISKRHQRPHQYLLAKPGSAYAEAVKSVFMQTHLANGSAPPRVILVTSTIPGEGKTTLAMSLAASVARSGHKAIVVDLDLRRPSVAREWGRTVRGGLLEFLSGAMTLDEVIQEDPGEKNLHVLPVKRGVESPTDHLASPMMRSLLAELRRRYDYVLLDSPPALGLSDAALAARLADAVLFIVQWEKTDEALAASGVDALMRVQAPVVGAAVTQVNVRRHARYGYGDVGTYHGAYRGYFAN